MIVALVCPDAFSVLLFCKGIIAGLRAAGWTRVLVVTDVGTHRAELEALGITCVDVSVARFIDPMGDVRYTLRLATIFRRERCDAVLNFSTKPNIYGSIAARIAGVSHVVSHVVGLGATFLPDEGKRARVMRRMMRGLYRVACRLSDRVWFTNRTDRAYFIDSGLVAEAKTVLTRNYLDTSFYAAAEEPQPGVDQLRYELGIADNDVVVLMVARLIRAKGVREFAEAAALLRVRRPECHFLLVAPPEPPSVQTISIDEVRALEARARLQWLGFRPDVRRLYALCDIAALPTYYKEGGYPRALLEPMSMGKPLITTTSEDCRGTVDEGQNGLLVPPRDVAALADAVERLAGDPALRARYGAHSRAKAVAEFDERPILEVALRGAGLTTAA